MKTLLTLDVWMEMGWHTIKQLLLRSPSGKSFQKFMIDTDMQTGNKGSCANNSGIQNHKAFKDHWTEDVWVAPIPRQEWHRRQEMNLHRVSLPKRDQAAVVYFWERFSRAAHCQTHQVGSPLSRVIYNCCGFVCLPKLFLQICDARLGPSNQAPSPAGRMQSFSPQAR